MKIGKSFFIMGIGFAIAVGVLGFLPLTIVLWYQRRIKRFKKTGERVTGVMEDVKLRTGHKGNRYYQATIQYPVAARSE